MRFFCFTLILLTALLVPVDAAETVLAHLEVRAGDHTRIETPISACLDGVTINKDHGSTVLYEITGYEKIQTPHQLELASSTRLWWILSGQTRPQQTRRFQLVMSDSIPQKPTIDYHLDSKVFTIHKNEHPILQYNHAVVPPPEGVSPLYERSGFIHPLWSPNGHVLTRIQPLDHYHHVGIWNPWTKTTFQGRHIDFWNLGGGQGTVRFAGFVSQINGPVYGGFQARQEHVDFSAPGPDLVAMNEVWDVRVWNVDSPMYLWDLHTTLSCATDSSINLEAYRYGGGLGFRATEAWTKDNCSVLTSEGKTRADADGSKARWCLVKGQMENGEVAGVLFMSHPENREFPEPMRVWPLDANGGRGDMFFEFCPIRHNNWRLLPGQDYRLKYRMLVFDGDLTPERAEQVWQDFAHPPRVLITIE